MSDKRNRGRLMSLQGFVAATLAISILGACGFRGVRFVLPLFFGPSFAAVPAPVFAAAEPMQVGAETPADVSALLDLERRVRAAAQKATPCIVAVETVPQGGKSTQHEPYASGVIIAADGLILTQYHVSHAIDSGDFEKSRKPGDRIKVILHDGIRVDAELLGADRAYDISLLRLVEPGPYPFAPIDGQVGMNIGDWVLKLGHPLGYRKGRLPVVRLGRVLCVQDGTFFTDCGITGGDSGGPFFDLDGRLVGIVRYSSGSELMHQAAQGRVAKRSDALFSCTANSLVQPRLESMLRGEVTSGDAAALRSTLERLSQANILDVSMWTQGAESAKAYRPVVEHSRSNIVMIRNGADSRILGTIVGEDGWIITKASELPAEPLCVLPDGKILLGVVRGVDPAFDVALLKIEASGLRPVEWSTAANPVVGTLVTTPGREDLPLAVGIVSVPRRDLAPPFPIKMTSRPQVPAGLPEVIGSAVQGRGYWIEYAEGHALVAGIQPGDVLLTIGGKPVRSHQDLATCVSSHWAGEVVPVQVLRAGKQLTVKLQMRAEGESVVSLRQDDFPTVFEHDTPLLIQECGGPIVGLDGKSLGINIAPVGAHGCMALPADCIQRMLADLKSGKLQANWIKPQLTRPIARIKAPPVGKPVSMTVDDLKRRLAERNAKFKSLFVEYEVLSEANVEPRMLMEWNLHHVRDYQELHRIAFAGDKRYTRTSHPAVMPMYAPQDQVLLSPNAPPFVIEAVTQQRQMAASNKAQNRSSHLFMRTQAETKCYVFDGTKTFVLDPIKNRMVPTQTYRFFAPTMYLAGLGLRPLDPGADAEQRKAQQQFWFPDSIALFDHVRILPVEEFVNGFACVVLEGEYAAEQEGKLITYRDKIWFDPKLDFAPRQWEQREEDTLLSLRTNGDFEDFGSGCWLPWESTWALGTPAWAPSELRNQPAYTFDMRLRKARVNDVNDEVFTPQ